MLALKFRFDDTVIHFIYVTHYCRHGEAEVETVGVTGKGDNHQITPVLPGAMALFASLCVID